MTTEHEVERLKQVYQGYAKSEAIQTLWSGANRGNQAIVQERLVSSQQLLQVTGFWPLTEYRILDIGCGAGDVLSNFISWGAVAQNLYGIDLISERVEAAKRQYPDIHFSQGNAELLTFQDSMFDVVIFFTVFSSILDPQMALHVAGEAARVLKPGGAIMWYDFRYRNPSNRHTQPMTKQKIQTLFPGFTLHLRTITLLPPLARRLGRLTLSLYPVLSIIPALRTHYLGLVVKPI